MSDLKLIALDADDLSVVSAHLQDAVLRVADMAYLPSEKRFAALVNRFDWERVLDPPQSGGGTAFRAAKTSNFARRRTALRIERVFGAKVQGFEPRDRRAVLELLAITFTPADDAETPGGDVTLTFSGGAAIRLAVECLELEMKDLGAAWTTKLAPMHPDEET